MTHDPDCECCKAGGPTPEFWARYHVQVRECIDGHGQFLQGVTGEEGTAAAFMYTIGNHERGLPELLAVGFYQNAVMHMLNAVGRIMRQRERAFHDGEVIDVGSAVKFKIIDADHAKICEDYTCGVERFYGTELYRVQQVILPDKHGRFPGDEDCEEPYASLPVLSAQLSG